MASIVIAALPIVIVVTSMIVSLDGSISSILLLVSDTYHQGFPTVHMIGTANLSPGQSYNPRYDTFIKPLPLPI